MKQKDGRTLREHLEAVEEQVGTELQELIGPPMPHVAVHIWEMFVDLHSGRGGGYGPSPLSWMEIESWQRMTRTTVQRWELRAIREIDRAWLESQEKNDD